MKKILILLLLCGCTRMESIEMVMENENNIKIAINYPNTEIKKLNNKIKKYTNNIYNNFKDKYDNLSEAELNIDYEYYKTDKYISVALYTYINADNLKYNDIKTYVYDIKNKKIVNYKDVVKEDYTNYIRKELMKKECVNINLINRINITNFIVKDNIYVYFKPDEIGKCPITSILIGNVKNEINNITYINQNNKIIDPNKKTIAITFDDGPSRYTSKIIEVLDRYNSSATFFVLGNKVNIYKETLNNMLSKGNEIGNHSYNHKWMARLDEEELKFQIDKTQSIIKENTGYTPTILRPTYGTINSKIRKLNLKLILWNIDSYDWKIKNSKKIADNILSKVEDMDIILFHDTYERTYKAIEIIVPQLISKGFQLVTVSELNEIKLLRN